MHARLDAEVHRRDQLITVGAENRDVLKDDVIGVDNLSTPESLLRNTFVFISGSSGDDVGIAVSRLRHNHDALVLTLAQITQHLLHLVDQRGVTRQVLHLLVRDDEAANCLGQVNQERRVANVVLRDLSLIVSVFGEISCTVGTEDGQTDDSVANHDGTVFDEHRIVDAH